MKNTIVEELTFLNVNSVNTTAYIVKPWSYNVYNLHCSSKNNYLHLNINIRTKTSFTEIK